MNKCILPSKQIAYTTKYFSFWLQQKMDKFDVTDAALAQYVGLERKTILAYRNGTRYPKLDVLIMIYDFFDEKAIYIPIGGKNDPGKD